MRSRIMRIVLHLTVVAALVVGGCATVPKEVVQLSYTVGQDMDAVHSSYRGLIRTHFDGLRTRTTTFLETRWVPAYLGEFIKDGELVEMAKNPDPVEAYQGVSAWVEVAVEEIENKKRELLAPIDQDEMVLLASVDEAFARLIRANATITAHLNSIRKVQEVEDEALKALRISDLRDEIDRRLVEASEKAERALTKVQRVKTKAETLSEEKKQLLERHRRGPK